MSSKADEQKCLEKVITEIKHHRGKSREILKKFANLEFFRSDDECPDFVKICPSNHHEDREILLGIEHFQVDHFSVEQKSGKVGATVNKFLKEESERRSIFNREMEQSGSVTNGAIEVFSKSVAQNLQNQLNADYNMYVRSFRYSLEKHLMQIDKYIDNLNHLSAGRYDIELAFLIDVYSDFSRLFLTSNNKTKLSNSDFIPLFDEVVSMLESIENRKVQYIVLCFNNLLHSRIKVVALHTNRIRKELSNQHIPVYQYLGEGRILKDMQITPSFTRDHDTVYMEMTASGLEMDEDQWIDQIMPSFLKALELQREGKPYATTQLVQVMIELFGDYYIKFEDLRDKRIESLWRYVMTVDWDRINERFLSFERKWFPEEQVGNTNEPVGIVAP